MYSDIIMKSLCRNVYNFVNFLSKIEWISSYSFKIIRYQTICIRNPYRDHNGPVRKGGKGCSEVKPPLMDEKKWIFWKNWAMKFRKLSKCPKMQPKIFTLASLGQMYFFHIISNFGILAWHSSFDIKQKHRNFSIASRLIASWTKFFKLITQLRLMSFELEGVSRKKVYVNVDIDMRSSYTYH